LTSKFHRKKSKHGKIAERGNFQTPNTPQHDRSLSWLGLGFSIKSGFMGLNLPF
jgi:hypothetical protein